jgi:hypothetical protein
MAWERSFEKRIDGIRQSELHWQARNYMIEVTFQCVWALTPVLVTVVSFLVRWRVDIDGTLLKVTALHARRQTRLDALYRVYRGGRVRRTAVCSQRFARNIHRGFAR